MEWEERFTRHTLLTINRRDNKYEEQGIEIKELPSQSHPVTATLRENTHEVQRVKFFLTPFSVPDVPMTILKHIVQLP